MGERWRRQRKRIGSDGEKGELKKERTTRRGKERGVRLRESTKEREGGNERNNGRKRQEKKE